MKSWLTVLNNQLLNIAAEAEVIAAPRRAAQRRARSDAQFHTALY